MQTIKDRINIFLAYKGFGQARFAELAGLSKGFVNIVGENISTKSLNKIRNTFPELNIDWLIRGEGEMLKPVSQLSGNLLVGDNNRNVQLGHGSKIMHGNEADQEVMSSLQARIIELETELIKKNGEIAVKDETIKGLQNELAIRVEMITFLQNHNKK